MKPLHIKNTRSYSRMILLIVACVMFIHISYAKTDDTKPSGKTNAMLGSLRFEARVDLDGDGIQDYEDVSPLPYGTTVTLNIHSSLTGNSTLVLGNNLLFENLYNLLEGTYTISLTEIPTGWSVTSNDTIIKSVSALTVDTVRFFFFKNISIGGKKFEDVNGNGYYDIGESGLSGWQFSLNGILNTTTDSAGTYNFTNVGPGNYTLTEIAQSGWLKTYPSNTGYFFSAFSGNNISYQDFGNFELGKIVVQVTIDQNGDGVVNSTDEVALPAGTQVIVTATMDTSFSYSVPVGNTVVSSYIPNLGKGSYQLTISNIPAGWALTTTGTSTVAIDTSSTIDTVRFMLFKKIQVSGKLFDDVNGNGTYDATEPGLSGWILYGSTLGNAVTDSLGNYVFSPIGPGTYSISEIVQSGWIRTAPANPSFTFTTISGNDIAGVNFGNFQLAKFIIQASIDIDGDGVPETTDNSPLPSGISINVMVQRDSTINIVRNVGNDTLRREVSFLPTGTYTISYPNLISGWVRTTPNNVTRVVSLSGTVDTIKFLFFKLMNISGRKYHDLNANGFRDTNEPGLSGWQINLNESTSVLTDSTGKYSFSNLGPGNYSVTETQQNNWMKTSPSGIGYSLNTQSGTNITDINFGNFMLGTISGKKFNDSNNNGIQETTEQGIADWKIFLSGTTVAVTTTDANGEYTFSNLPPGAYKVREGIEQGWVQTYPASGSYTDTIATGGQVLSNRNFGNYQPPNSLSGMMFYDINANGVKDSADTALSNWEIKLYNSARTIAKVDTTDSLGYYAFLDLSAGTYIIKEVMQDGWIQTFPTTSNLITGEQPGVYVVTVMNGERRTNLDFGNTTGCRYIGVPGGSWNDPANWSCGQAPNSETPIIIPRDTLVVVDSLSSDSIHSVRIQEGGNLEFGALHRRLHVQGSIQIDSGGTLTLPNDDSTGLILYGDWLNNGLFNPGTSTITFDGDSAKTIVAGSIVNDNSLFSQKTGRKEIREYSSNRFYNLVINGQNTSVIGNLRIENTLTLAQSLDTRVQDTVFIENSLTDAIDSTGILPRGSIQRQIDKLNGGTYRFESPSSTLTFRAGDELPDSAMITTIPDTTTEVFSLHWKLAGGTVDSAGHTVTVDSLSKFSKWVFGRPGSGYKKGTSSSNEYGVPTVRRAYTITTANGGDFKASLQLKFDENEVMPGESVSNLQLLQGPVVAENVNKNWNIVSVPVIPETTMFTTSLFPGASSSAFEFDQDLGYVAQTSLETGKAYWLKFGNDKQIGILGEERIAQTLDLTAGWNMIGSLSFPIPVSAVLDNGAGISANFFGYDNGYYIADSLEPMKGYWIKAQNTGSITLDAAGAFSSKSYSEASDLRSLNSITITDATHRSQTLYFGMSVKKSEQNYEMPPAPPSGAFDARFANQSMLVVSEANVMRSVPVLLSSVTYPVSVQWNISPTATGYYSLKSDKRTVPMVNSGQTVLAETSELRLELSPSKQDVLPVEFMLHQNYPNPFNPVTSIRYSLPSKAYVSLIIYDVLGREIAKLTEGLQEPGIITREWNASTVPSGIYFYRLNVFATEEQGSSMLYQEQRKMLLIK